MRKVFKKQRMPRSSFFSLIEMLVVVAIIALLATLMMPAVLSTLQKGDITKAKADTEAIVKAINAYAGYYGCPPGFDCNIGSYERLRYTPGDPNRVGDTIVGCTGDGAWQRRYDILMQVLTTVDCAAPTPQASNKAYVANTRKVQFLKPTATYKEDHGFVDPWGHRYVVLLNYNFDNHFAYSGWPTLYGSRVYVYSLGPNGSDQKGGGDDICSWK